MRHDIRATLVSVLKTQWWCLYESCNKFFSKIQENIPINSILEYKSMFLGSDVLEDACPIDGAGLV